MEATLNKIKELLKTAKTILVASHVDPDGDSIGSMLAIGLFMEKQGKNATLFSADGVPKVYRFLSGSEKVVKNIPTGKIFDIAFVIDSSDISRIGSNVELRDIAKTIVNIDHHPDNTNFGDINCVKPTSSTAEIIFGCIKEFMPVIDKGIAENLYTAIITDTGNFRYENTSKTTMLIAAELLETGISTHEITSRIYDVKSIPSVKICAMSLLNLKFAAENKIAWTIVDKKMLTDAGARIEDTIGIVDIIRSIDGVEVAILFREENGRVKVNLRSKNKANVSEIAKRFGGGGHHKASGIAMDDSISQAEKLVINEAIKQLSTLG
ncbi:MAG: bifunctional oligoribonuclease/PAP phosphatase NrnA [Candidatus Margulisiibacteriota bacterium]